MLSIFIYRNCFSGGVAGGDTHIAGVINWILDNETNAKISLIRSGDDGQDKYFPEVKRVQNVTYRAPRFTKNYAILFIIRAFLASFIKLPLTKRNTYVASSHFLPDVLPVYVKQLLHTNDNSVVYIHHIIRDMNRVNSINNTLANFQERICFSLIKGRFKNIIITNPSIKKRLIELGFNDKKISVSTNFITTTRTRPIKLYKKQLDLVFCGRLVKQKGVYDFLWVVENLVKQNYVITAKMMGIGPEYETMHAFITERSLPIELLGFTPEKIKHETISKAKCFLFPSYEEGWGIVIAEALSLGTKVVAYRLPAYKGLFDSMITQTKIGNKSELLLNTAAVLKDNDEKSYSEWQNRTMQHAKSYKVSNVAPKEYDLMSNSIFANG